MSLVSTSGAALQARDNPFPGLIIRERDPENLEFPFYALNSSLTPNDQFFVRSHFPVPKIDINSWSLRVEGLVEHPLDLSFDQLSALPARTVTMVMECAGNSRIFLSPKVGGLQWEMGAVATPNGLVYPWQTFFRRPVSSQTLLRLFSKEPTAAKLRRNRCRREKSTTRAVCRCGRL